MNLDTVPPPPAISGWRPRSRRPGSALLTSSGVCVAPVADPVGMAVRQGDEIAGGEIDGVAVVDFTARTALAEQVIDDHVGAVASEERREHVASGASDAPRLGELAVQIDRRIDFDGAKHFGKRVHCRQSTTGFRLIGQVRGTRG